MMTTLDTSSSTASSSSSEKIDVWFPQLSSSFVGVAVVAANLSVKALKLDGSDFEAIQDLLLTTSLMGGEL